MAGLLSSEAPLWAYVAQIVEHLGDAYEIRESYGVDRPLIVHRTIGAEFWVGTYRAVRDSSTRLAIHANWPRDASGTEVRPYFSQYSEFGEGPPTMHCSMTRPPAVAARDIERRFLKPFLPLWLKQRAAVDAQNCYQANRLELARDIVQLLGGRVSGEATSTASAQVKPQEHGIHRVDHGDNRNALDVHIACSFAELQQLAIMFKERP
jgi:hypothetical protein